jgi:hypothetical protein
MKTTSIFVLVSGLALALGATTACGSDDDDGGGGGKAGTGATGGSSGGNGGTGGTGGGSGGTAGATGGSGGTGGGNPAAPALGTQIDRMGRPAINTALNKVLTTDAAVKQAGKDAYNHDTTTSNWATQYGAEFAGNLAVFDGLDNDCGNQLLYTPTDSGSPYGTLAGALSSDWLIVDTTKTACGYLGVEAPILGLGAGNCGGRKLTDDVIDLSYSGLAAGTSGFPGGAPAVGDDVASNDSAFTDTFPYLAVPH